MSKVTTAVREKIIALSDEYQAAVEDYDFWNEHIKLVVDNASKLADKFGADREIVELGALLHDVALVSLIKNKSDYLAVKADHHETGAKIAVKILQDLDYPADKIEQVRNCVLHHRSSKNSTTIEETCVADADILAHFDNLMMIFENVFRLKNMNLADGREAIKKGCEKDFDDLSDRSKADFASRYETIMSVLFGRDDR